MVIAPVHPVPDLPKAVYSEFFAFGIEVAES